MMVFTDENFEKEISEAKKPFLVDFWMKGCTPCVLIAPILEKLAEELKEEISFAKVNLNIAPLAVQKYGVNAVPTVILFKEGKPVGGFVGMMPEENIRVWLKENLQEEGEEDKSSSSPFAAARVEEGKEDKSSSSPFAAARVDEGK
ncbi:MAG: thioredoxin fold domain-containing protein, partial [Candidatus Pacebacteria bacterium]|nr:thioredoxin fold domain-containing protein [Candidatus Paceibacterota bacterium]